ncbi:serine/threonine-protein kinase [Streptomyces sp. NPDC017202]|uniref:serine/threonine-protein kinase n=1 Tax=Streptomyces sp. NPDC017202 TaxID=3364981 RepID=UPI00378FA0A6
MSVHPRPPVAERPREGRVLAGRYRLGSLVGRGGAADVHAGFDLRLRRRVAVKVFRGGAEQSEESFTDEAVLLAGLQHPGLVTVYDSGRDEELPFLVMQFLEGLTLRARIGAGALPPATVRELGAALAEALAYVHAAGVVHRDVKPSNILLDTAGAPHLSDFGISRPADGTGRTAPDVLEGTAAYLAPEQVMSRQAGPAADVYALGLTLLECVKGELEYPGAPLQAAIARLHRPPVLPRFLDDELAGLLAAMTAEDPQARPAAASCARALAAMNTPDATGAAGTSGVSGALFGHTGGSRAAAGRTATPAAPRRPGGRTLAVAGAALAAVLGVTLTGSIGAAPDDGTPRAQDPGAGAPPATGPVNPPATVPDTPAGPASGAPSAAADETTAATPAARTPSSGQGGEAGGPAQEPPAADGPRTHGKPDKTRVPAAAAKGKEQARSKQNRAAGR